MLPLSAFFQLLDDGLVDDLAVVHRRLHVLVSEQPLHRSHVYPLHEQQRGVGMAGTVEGEVLAYSCLLGDALQAFVYGRV